MALQQAMRAERGSARHLPADAPPLERELCLLLEARAAEDALVRLLPGMAASLASLRCEALLRRPKLSAFTVSLQAIEILARSPLTVDAGKAFASALPNGLAQSAFALPATPAQVRQQARALFAALGETTASALEGTRLLWRDSWTGDLRVPPAAMRASGSAAHEDADSPGAGKPSSARLSRRPEVRESDKDEDDDDKHGAWMVQTAQPHEQAEDPMGLQRPTDRDKTTAAEDLADAVSELPEARLVSAPGRPKEGLISDDPLIRTPNGPSAN